MNLTYSAMHQVTLDALYTGDLFKCEQCPESAAIVEYVRAKLHSVYSGDLDTVHQRLNVQTIHSIARQLRNTLLEDPVLKELTGKLTKRIFGPNMLIDTPQLRCVNPETFMTNTASNAFAGHRDTWYAYPQSLVNFWIALNEVVPEQTFEFYPDVFAKPIENESARFDYDAWRCGAKETVFPKANNTVDVGKAVGFAALPGDFVVFAGQHYHKTTCKPTHRMRFSLDFRVIPKDWDRAGAANVDNASGSNAKANFKPL